MFAFPNQIHFDNWRSPRFVSFVFCQYIHHLSFIPHFLSVQGFTFHFCFLSIFLIYQFILTYSLPPPPPFPLPHTMILLFKSTQSRSSTPYLHSSRLLFYSLSCPKKSFLYLYIVDYYYKTYTIHILYTVLSDVVEAIIWCINLYTENAKLNRFVYRMAIRVYSYWDGHIVAPKLKSCISRRNCALDINIVYNTHNIIYNTCCRVSVLYKIGWDDIVWCTRAYSKELDDVQTGSRWDW